MRLDDSQKQLYQEYLQEKIPGYEHLLPDHDMLFTLKSHLDRLQSLIKNWYLFKENNKGTVHIRAEIYAKRCAKLP